MTEPNEEQLAAHDLTKAEPMVECYDGGHTFLIPQSQAEGSERHDEFEKAADAGEKPIMYRLVYAHDGTRTSNWTEDGESLREYVDNRPDWFRKIIVESSAEERATLYLTKDELETVVNALSNYSGHGYAERRGIGVMVHALTFSLIGTHDWNFGPVPPSKWMMGQIDQMELSADIDAEADEETFEKAADIVVELGPDCAAAGEKFVIEAKEDASYTLARARAEIETARKNRGARVGLFVFSAQMAPAGIDMLVRHGDDVFLVWEAEKIESDVILRAGLSLAKALCVRQQKDRDDVEGNWEDIDAAILAVEKEAGRLASMKTWTETIQSNSGKILDEVRKMTDNLEKQVAVLRESVETLRQE